MSILLSRTRSACTNRSSKSFSSIVRNARRTMLRLPEGFRYANVFRATLDAVYALPPP
jgi:hypothetical protein